MRKKSLGKLGENLAAKHFQNKGYQFIARNFTSRFGEIDLIFQDNNILVFVEVKTRFSKSFGRAEEAVTSHKIKSIIKTGDYFKLLHPELPDSLRIDVVAIELELELEEKRLLTLRHIKNVTG